MRNNSDGMTEDDLRAIEQAVRENAQYDFTIINHHLEGKNTHLHMLVIVIRILLLLFYIV